LTDRAHLKFLQLELTSTKNRLAFL
jgi:hypothetical protein